MELRHAGCGPHARIMEPPESINAGELVLRHWEPRWAEEAAAAVRDSLLELKPFLPWAHDEYDARYVARLHHDVGGEVA